MLHSKERQRAGAVSHDALACAIVVGLELLGPCRAAASALIDHKSLGAIDQLKPWQASTETASCHAAKLGQIVVDQRASIAVDAVAQPPRLLESRCVVGKNCFSVPFATAISLSHFAQLLQQRVCNRGCDDDLLVLRRTRR